MITKQKAYYLLIGFFLFFYAFVYAQDQKLADSARVIYDADNVKGVERLELLKILSYYEQNDLEAALNYSDELIELSTAEKNHRYTYHGYASKGYTLRLLGDFTIALDALYKSTEAAKKAEDLESEAASYSSIADVFSEMGNAVKAELFYNKGIEILRGLDNPVTLASALLNAGDGYFKNGNYIQALKNYEESGLIFKNENHLIGTAYTLGNVGKIHAEEGNLDLAEKNISQAITILEGYGDQPAISEYLTYMSDIYMKQEDLEKALRYAERSLGLAKKYGLKKQIGESNKKLYELHQQAGHLQESFAFYKEHIKYRDSVRNLENIESSANQTAEFEVAQFEASKKLAMVRLLNEQAQNQRIIIFATAIVLLIGLLALALFRRNRYVQKTNTIIANEKERSEDLLLNILPAETTKELKEKGKVIAKKFNSVTVLFTDFIGFTHFAENLSPELLVETVDFYFSQFDKIIEKYQLEKIKTIGDAYMCAGGLHQPKKDHAKRMVQAAFEIAEFVDAAKKQYSEKSPRFDIRIGINTGPVVAGVVGTKKFAYDIWGDSVNIACRMESNSEIGRINISENTYALINDDFECEYRGEFDVKNRGLMKMYFVNSFNKVELENVLTRSEKI